MPTLYPTAALRRLEGAALAALPPGTLMARAATAVADATARLARTLGPGRPVLALVGPGNNGGDAVLAALLLRERGYACDVIALRPDRTPGGDAGEAWRRARAAGLRIEGVGALADRLAADPIVIDGLFGTGLDRPLDGDAGRVCEAVAKAALPVVAVDVPSGVDADTGAIVGGSQAPAMRALRTVTMIADKPGLHTGAALDRVGEVIVAPLDLDAERDAFAASAGDEVGMLFDAACAAAAWRPRARDSNKGSFGTVLVFGGDTGMRGAPLLAARGAQALGAGKVTVGTPRDEAFDPAQPHLMTAPHDPDFAACDAVVIGCGLGQGAAARERVADALASGSALVLDADALNLVAAEPSLVDSGTVAAPTSAPARPAADARRVMTPHPLEAARLLGCSAMQVQADRRATAVAMARRYRMVVLLKGAGSIVATPGGAWTIVDEGAPALASAGTGDVLAGMIGALLARGAPAAEAACVAAWLHGRAGTRFELAHGHAEGLGAVELPALLRGTLDELARTAWRHR
ncbi:MAG TPA: NAD(P)H-hydrate dehydratase [Zeimonas sp.]|nr:NAD(P)H-hydrate dehydratase [Zeimonas sp.]